MASRISTPMKGAAVVILATGFAELPPGADEGLPKLSKPFLQQQLADAIARTVAV